MTLPLTRDWDSEFAAIVYAEHAWLRAEFDALVHASLGDGAGDGSPGGVGTAAAPTRQAGIRVPRPGRVPHRGVAPRRRHPGPRPRPPPGSRPVSPRAPSPGQTPGRSP